MTRRTLRRAGESSSRRSSKPRSRRSTRNAAASASRPSFRWSAPIRLALHLHRDDGDSARRTHRRRCRSTRSGGGRSTTKPTADSSVAPTRAIGSSPHREKLLDVNAALIDLYVEAATILDSQRYADRAQDALRYVAELARGSRSMADGPAPSRRNRRRLASDRAASGMRRSARCRSDAVRELEWRDDVRGAARRARVPATMPSAPSRSRRSNASSGDLLQAGTGRRALHRRRQPHRRASRRPVRGGRRLPRRLRRPPATSSTR